MTNPYLILKNLLIIILLLIGHIAIGQEKDRTKIDIQVHAIEANSNLTKVKFDLERLTGIVTDGGGTIEVWLHKNKIYMIVEEVGLSYGRLTTTIYLKNELPIKIIETEENFKSDKGELDYSTLENAHIAIIYIHNWKKNKTEIEYIGERLINQGDHSTHKYEAILELAKKAIAK